MLRIKNLYFSLLQSHVHVCIYFFSRMSDYRSQKRELSRALREKEEEYGRESYNE